MNANQFARLWVVADLADWRVYEGREPFYVSHPQLSRVLCTYYTCFAVRPYDWLTWLPPNDRRSTDKPSVPKYLLYFTYIGSKPLELWPNEKLRDRKK